MVVLLGQHLTVRSKAEREPAKAADAEAERPLAEWSVDKPSAGLLVPNGRGLTAFRSRRKTRETTTVA